METACGRIFDVFTITAGASGSTNAGCGVLMIFLLASNAYPAYYWAVDPALSSNEADQIPLLPLNGVDSTSKFGKVLTP